MGVDMGRYEWMLEERKQFTVYGWRLISTLEDIVVKTKKYVEEEIKMCYEAKFGLLVEKYTNPDQGVDNISDDEYASQLEELQRSERWGCIHESGLQCVFKRIVNILTSSLCLHCCSELRGVLDMKLKRLQVYVFEDQGGRYKQLQGVEEFERWLEVFKTDDCHNPEKLDEMRKRLVMEKEKAWEEKEELASGITEALTGLYARAEEALKGRMNNMSVDY